MKSKKILKGAKMAMEFADAVHRPVLFISVPYSERVRRALSAHDHEEADRARAASAILAAPA
jgi:hypothetical protein